MTPADMRGKPCPIPVIKAKKLLAATPPGSAVSMLVDNEAAAQNLAKLAAGLGHGVRTENSPDGNILVTFTVRKSAGSAGPAGPSVVIAVGSDTMGRGDDELGRLLMKSFLYSLTEQDAPPEQMLFFNAGIHLTCTGSNALDDIAALAAKGTAVSSCGACLNFYGKTDDLRIGSITNMYAIVGAMSQAGRLITL